MLRTLFRTTVLLTLVAIPLACDSGSDPVVAAAIELFAPVDVLPAGQTAALEVQVEDEDGDIIANPDVEFTSGSTTVASVNDEGVVTGVGAGEVTFTATAGAVSDEVSLFVFDFDDLCTEALLVRFNEPVRASLQPGDCDELIDDGSFVDLWYFEIETVQTVTIDLASADFDAYMWLITEGNVDVAEDDDSGTDTNARIVETLAPGVYFIMANHYPPETGVYTIEVSTSTTADPALRSPTVETTRKLPGKVRVRRP